MAYRGQVVPIVFGKGGWNAHENQELITLDELQEAKNVRFDGDMVVKAPGLAALNSNSVYSNNAIAMAGLDYWSDKVTQNQLTVWSDGVALREDSDIINQNSVSWGNQSDEPVTLLKCGNEQVGLNAKVMYLQGGTQTVFLTGMPTTFALSNIANPSADWSAANWPASGIIHDSRVVAWGNDNAPHAIYFSTLEDHTDFLTGTPPIYDISAGIGQYITACASIQTTRLFIWKYPRGIFMIDTENLPSYYMPVTTIRDDIGAPGPHCVCKVGSLGTWFIASDGHIYSLESLNNPDVDIQDASITQLLGLQKWFDENVDVGINALKFARLLYDATRKEVWAIYRQSASTSNDIALIFDVKNPQQVRVALEDRGTYINAAWLAYNTTSKKYEVYTAGDTGYIYRANQAERSIVDGNGSTAYEGIAHTPDNDLGSPFTQKRFDWLEVYIKGVGSYPLYMRTYIDGEFYGSYQFDQGTAGSFLEPSSESEDYLAPDPSHTEFTLASEGFVRHKIKIGGLGKRISLRFYNAEADQDFGLAKAVIYFKPLGQTGEE